MAPVGIVSTYQASWERVHHTSILYDHFGKCLDEQFLLAKCPRGCSGAGDAGCGIRMRLDNGGSNECDIILLSKAPVAVTLVLQDCAAIACCVRRLPRGSLIGTHNDRTEALR